MIGVHKLVSVVAVEAIGDHRVLVQFSDGTNRERDLAPLLTGPVFESIRTDPDSFAAVTVDTELGVLAWPDGPDIDAELLRYDDLWTQTIESIMVA